VAADKALILLPSFVSDFDPKSMRLGPKARTRHPASQFHLAPSRRPRAAAKFFAEIGFKYLLMAGRG
jgi:hypothetical protein